MLGNGFDEVMQALRNEYSAFSAFKSITEDSKKEKDTTTASASQFTSKLSSKSYKAKVTNTSFEIP